MFLKLLFTRIKKKNKLTRTNRSNRSQRSLALPCPPNGPRKGRLSCLILDRFSNSNDMKETTVICSIRAQFQFDPFSFSSLPFPSLLPRAREHMYFREYELPPPLACELTGSPVCSMCEMFQRDEIHRVSILKGTN